MPDVEKITRLLRDVEAGRDGALDELMNAVYADLERMARAQLQKQFGAQAARLSLEPAALVNESFMKLIRQRAAYDNRGHFFSIATRMMLRVLMDYRRRRGTAKRGGAHLGVTVVFNDQAVAGPGGTQQQQIDLDALMVALEDLEGVDPRKADVVKMRIVWGLTGEEVGEALAISRSTVEREWRFAKAWLIEAVSAA